MRSYMKNAMGITEDQELTIDEIIECMQKHFRSKQNIAVDRVNFQRRRQ